MQGVNADFVRSLPGDRAGLANRPSAMLRWHIDLPLLGLLLVLAGFGLMILYSASGQDLGRVIRQGVYWLVALAAMLVVAQFPLKDIKALAPLGYAVGLVLLVLVLLVGDGAKGAQRWLDVFGLLRFQPSEIMKIVVPLTVARYLSSRLMPPNLRSVVVAVLLALLPPALIVLQPDLGTALLIGASGLFVLWLAGLRWSYLLAGALAALASLWPAWQFMLHDYQRQRILTLFNPESDRLGSGWNIIQSKTAIGSGGLEGKGWLNGTQSHLDFLPESHTDFVIAVLAEEFGLLGVLLLLTLYLLVILRGAYISLNARDSFGRLAAGSITLTFFVYVLVNMGMVSGLLPVVGVPLPLVSYGGTALVTLLASFGVLMAIATEPR